MSDTSLHPHPHAVKYDRFVAPTEFDQGRTLYRGGKPLRQCVTDDMAAGWLAAERKGVDAYWLGMMQEAN